MNIWLVQIGEQLPIRNGIRKMRTAVLADNLLERGHKVLWWASAFEHQQKIMLSYEDRNFDVSERYTIRVLRGCRYHKNVSPTRYIDHLIVALKFRTQSKKFRKPDVMVVSLPDHLLSYEAARYARKNGVAFLVDIRDLWPDIFLSRFKNMGLHGLGKMLLARDFLLLASLLKSADALMAVSKGYLQWGLDKIERVQSPFDRVFYLGYRAESEKGADDRLDVPDWLKGRERQKLFVFIGTFGVSYELELILKAAWHFSESGRDDIFFVLAGSGEQYELIKKKASRLQNVVLPGWIGNKEIGALLKNGYAGLLSYIKDAPQGLPNKPFEYLSAGLPLVNSLEGEMADLVDLHGFGLNYLPGDLVGLCACIERLVADPVLYDEISRKALAFFERCGNANKIYDEYANHIERVAEAFYGKTRIV